MLRIHVRSNLRSSGTVAVGFPAGGSASALGDVIYVPVPRRQDLALLPREMYEGVAPRTRRLSRTFILRAHRDEARELTSNAECVEALEERFPRAEFYVVHHLADQLGITAIGSAPVVDGAVHEELLQLFRSAELQTLALDPAALLPTSNNFHYVGPSGEHHRSFLRVASALQSIHALDAACFWLQDEIRGQRIVVLDSPTLITLGLGLAQYLRDQYIPADVASVAAVDVLHACTDEAQHELANRLSRIQQLVDSPLAVLFVGSIAATGGTLDRLHRAADESGLPHETVVLYKVRDSAFAPDVMALAEAPSNLAPMRPCTECAPGTIGRSPAIVISPTTLHIEFSSAISREKITRRHANAAKDFLSRYGGAGVVQVHKTETDGHFRHHAVSIDGAAMLKLPAFRDALAAKLDELATHVDAILCPEHDAALEFAEFVRGRLGIDPIMCDESNLAGLSDDERAKILKAKSLLILDDVVISGDRLRGYRQFLFELGRGSGPVHVLVAMCRPSSAAEAETIRNLVDQLTPAETSFHTIEEVILPNWGEDSCPWCIEDSALNRYNGMGEDFEYSDEFLARAELLDPPFQGLSDELFWSADGTPLPLGEGSIFAPGDATQAELFFSVSSAIQTMRSEERLEEDHRPPVAKILQHEFWVRGRFYAPAITAAILRASRPHDLMPSMPSNSMLRSVQVRLTEAASHAVVRELLWAISQAKLPWCDAVDTALGDEDQDDVVLDFFGTEISRAWREQGRPPSE